MRAASWPAPDRLLALSLAWLSQRSAPALLVLLMAALALAVPLQGEFPINDDWLYARVVQTLLEQGELQVPAWAAASLVLQAYWGALFAHLFGFSHTALRMSTLVLSAAAVLGCYALLVELLDQQRALLGTLLLLFNPLYVFLSYSFLTDVPFLALALWALACYVRALRGPRLHLGWLAAGSTLAGGAFLVRQLGAALPLAVIGSLVLRKGWRQALSPRDLALTLGPLVPAVLVGLFFDIQRGPVREEPLAWTVNFWAKHGAGMLGVLLVRLAETCSTLGLFTLPVSFAALTGCSRLHVKKRQLCLTVMVGLVLLLGLALHIATFNQSPLFPHLGNTLYNHGFMGYSIADAVTPESVMLSDFVLVAVTAAALLGSGLLAIAAIAVLTRETFSRQAGVPLLFGLLALGLTLPYTQFFDRYLVAVLPSALLVALLAFPSTARSWVLALTGVAVLAGWSIWWEREYLERRAALWQAGQMLVARGIPPEEIDGDREWNGWYRGQAVIASAVQQAQAEGGGEALNAFTRKGLDLDMRQAPWALAYGTPETGYVRVAAVVPYGRGYQVIALQRY